MTPHNSGTLQVEYELSFPTVKENNRQMNQHNIGNMFSMNKYEYHEHIQQNLHPQGTLCKM